MAVIVLDKDVYTSFFVDLNFSFDNIEKVVLTAKNKGSEEIVFKREFVTNGEHEVVITPDETDDIHDGAEYDFNIIYTQGSVANERRKNGDNGFIQVRDGVGSCNDL